MVMGEDDGLLIGDFELDEETDAMIIQDYNFDQALEQFDRLVIYFYKEECPHCAGFTPIYADVVKTLRSEGNINFAVLNIEDEPELAERFNLKYETKNTPQMLLFVKGQEEPDRYRIK